MRLPRNVSHSTLTLNANGSYDSDAAAGESDTRTVDTTVTAVDDASVIKGPATCNTTSYRRATPI